MSLRRNIVLLTASLLLVHGVSRTAWAQDTVDIRVEADHDDAEEDSGGGISLENDKLELGQMRWVAFRFLGVGVPQGATVTSAQVEMRADDANSESTDLTLFGEDADSAAAFVEQSNDLSNRVRTSALVAWQGVSNWKKNTQYLTPDIAAVIQEIVDRPGWASGNNLAILIRSDDLDGKRLAVSHDGQHPKAPLLHITFERAAPPPPDPAEGLVLSTRNQATLAGLTFKSEDFVDYVSQSDTARLLFDGSELFQNQANVDAVHVLSSGNFILSTAANENIGGVTFHEEDLVEYNPFTGIATPFLDGQSIFGNNSEDIDAVHVLGNGDIVLSVTTNAAINGLSFGRDDLVVYDPDSGTASLLFEGDSVFANANENIDAVQVLSNGHILLSTADNATIGMLSFTQDDIVEYDPDAGTASLYFEGLSHFAQGSEDVDALHLVGGGGSQPSTGSHLVLAENASVPSVGSHVDANQPIGTQIAGQSFGVTIVAVDDYGDRLSTSDALTFPWSTPSNWVTPSSPPNPVALSGAPNSVNLSAGVATVTGLSLADVGEVKITVAKGGLQTGESSPFVVRPSHFAVTADCGAARGPNSSNTHVAGAPFTIQVQAVNAAGTPVQNYHAASASSGALGITPMLTQPSGGTAGTLRGPNGGVLTRIDRAQFAGSGSTATLQASHSEVGIIDLQVLDMDFLGQSVSGTAANLGRFIPDHFDVSVSAVEAIPGLNADFTYGGQEFDLTLTVTARNAVGAGATTRNYEGNFAKLSADNLAWLASLANGRAGAGAFSDTLGAPLFVDGLWAADGQATYSWSEVHVPEIIRFRLASTDEDGVTGAGECDLMEFRAGRIRFLDNHGPHDAPLAILATVECLDANGEWKLNVDDSTTTLDAAAIEVVTQSGSGSAGVNAARATISGGQLLADPTASPQLATVASGVNESLAISLSVVPDSEIGHLSSLPGDQVFQNTPGGSGPVDSSRLNRRILMVRDR